MSSINPIDPALYGVTAAVLPPGEDWMPWDLSPPQYKRGRVVEIWRREMGNETGYLRVENVCAALNIAGLWWRSA